MGAWIETDSLAAMDLSVCFAPRVGAWIETSINSSAGLMINFAPRVGAWIETDKTVLDVKAEISRPAWARGLKHRLL